MEERTLGRTGKDVSVVGFGAWQIGASWGHVDEDEGRSALRAAADSGVTFIDTADVYGDGRSERLVGELLKERPGLTVATKMGRRAAQDPANYNPDNFREWNDRSRANLGVDTVDLVQLHCPPPAVYSTDAVFDDLDAMVEEGRMRAYGVSVETCEEALAAIARPNVATVQIILNAFRHKPLERVLPEARAAGVGVIARVPLASGLLSGRYTAQTTFADNDHRTFNRSGAAFDVGETFSGLDFETGLAATERIRELLPEDMTMVRFALRWILDQPGVSTVIPGARGADQARGNASAASLAPLPPETHTAVRGIYDDLIRPQVHHRW
ncbi:aryl-alcohol dehydrogenase-like predicted oxidoreductase [Lipingzhangella halophila]|uniref:Aryl-alcohol dehydrogenase-like predicted oxidoreductase n=1 Tax=Lipingzhangella halophila TaxID=1783352 RepID=A0A7W7W1N1_9ACTN|nr:aldo/keto reductase [Lipingzhangella halophila]MBB4930493.1 aryl-alcohol dehydrogenase-like predicted oxidoreductase [Lipingzhangella halophila]